MNRLNRHAMKRRHKRETEKKYAKGYAYGSGQYDVGRLRRKLMAEAAEGDRHGLRNNGWEYWQVYYLTGRRQYAKKYSDKRIRQKYRIMIRQMDPDDVTAPRGADYEKEYDDAWTIW